MSSRTAKQIMRKAQMKGRSPGPKIGLMQKQLVPRIKKILSETEGYISSDKVFELLRKQYSEYTRKPAAPFRREVEQAYQTARSNSQSESSLQSLEAKHINQENGKGDMNPAFVIDLKGESSPVEEQTFKAADQNSDSDEETSYIAVNGPSRNLLNKNLQKKYKAQNTSSAPETTGELISVPNPADDANDTGTVDITIDLDSGPSAPASEAYAAEEQGRATKRQKRLTNSERRSIRAKAIAEITAATTHPSSGEEVTDYKIPRPTVRFDDIGGIDHCLQDIREIVELMFTHIELFKHLGTQPPRGVLIQGPPGCGKTLLAHAIAGELDVPFFKVSAPALVGSASGDSEKSIRQLFEQATAECDKSPRGCIIFIDEVDVITPKRENAAREMERRIVAQLLTCMDDASLEKTHGKPLLVLGATNRADALDSALRRASRFDREITIPVPDKAGREKILQVLCKKLRLEGDFDFGKLATMSPGYVGADFLALTNEAALLAVSRAYNSIIGTSGSEMSIDGLKIAKKTSTDGNITPMKPNGENVPTTGTPTFRVNALGGGSSLSLEDRELASSALRAQQGPFSEDQLSGVAVTFADFEGALTKVQPSAKREGFATVPEVSWDDVGALAGPREELEDAIVLPLTNPELCRQVGIPKPPGVLLYGPPGCGKTLLAKAVANGSHANFISVKGPELLNKFVGESERAVRQVFQRARTSSPCIVFFDELDALCPVRENDSSSRSTQRLVNQLLTEMDGFDGGEGKQVFIIGATNRPDIIDPAIMRPGRLDKLVYVDVPSEIAREEILKTHTRKLKLSANVDLHSASLDAQTKGFTGADLAALTREAGTAALRRLLKKQKNLSVANMSGNDAPVIEDIDFREAFKKVGRSVNEKNLAGYRRLVKKMRGAAAMKPTEEDLPSSST